MGYCFQGGGKYGFYEGFKYLYGDRLFPGMNKTVVYLGASASAEFLADMYVFVHFSSTVLQTCFFIPSFKSIP